MLKIIFFTTTLLSAFSLRAQNAGLLDNTLDSDGKLTTSIRNGLDKAHTVIVQSDGKILMAGYSDIGFGFDFALARYQSDGTLDNTFDTDGKLTTNVIPNGTDISTAVIQQPDGKIVAAGYGSTGATGEDQIVVRYNIDGSLDNTFGTGGAVTTDVYTTGDQTYSIALQPDGKILVAGFSTNFSSGQKNVSIIRYNPNGTLDNTFDGDGKVLAQVVGGSRCYEMALQTDGKIVLGGSVFNGNDYDFAVFRYNIDGSLDNTFDNDGVQTTAFGNGDDNILSLKIQNDGKIVSGGYTADNNGILHFALARYNTDGSLDSGFDSDGMVTTALSSQQDFINSIVISSSGKIVAAGAAMFNSKNSFEVVRYNSNGMLDNTFGTNGAVTTDFSNINDAFPYSIALQSDGKVVVGGYSSDGVKSDFALARYLWDLKEVGVLEFNTNKNNFIVYPNPIQQIEILEYELKNDETISIDLLDVNGQIIQNFISEERQSIGSHKIMLDISKDLTSGFYYLRITSSKGQTTIKIIK